MDRQEEPKEVLSQWMEFQKSVYEQWLSAGSGIFKPWADAMKTWQEGQAAASPGFDLFSKWSAMVQDTIKIAAGIAEGGISSEVLVLFWKSSWESYKNILALMQEQADKMSELFFSQSQSLQKGVQKNVKDMLSAAQKAQTAYIQAVDDALKKIEDIMVKRKAGGRRSH